VHARETGCLVRLLLRKAVQKLELHKSFRVEDGPTKDAWEGSEFYCLHHSLWSG